MKRWNYSEFVRKNRDDLITLITGSYPKFVYTNSSLAKNETPVFTFHSIDKEIFESQCKFLYENNYYTCNADDLFNIITGHKKVSDKTVVLTFDDGLANLWTIVFPILKKYNIRVISFIIPFYVTNSSTVYPNLEDCWSDKAFYKDLEKREKNIPFCTWEEIRIMEKSGLVDFQSHSYTHSTVFVSSALIGFVNPDEKPFFLERGISPLFFRNGKNEIANTAEPGYPLYKSAPNLATPKRFLEDELVSDLCTKYVKENGGNIFFKNPDWKKKLRRYYFSINNSHNSYGHYQKKEERFEEIRSELTISKNIIEKELNKSVEHLCYPWFYGCDESMKLSKEAGYKTNFRGIVNNNAINKIGDDPFYLKRISERYIFRLPGKNSKKLFSVLKDKLLDSKRTVY